MNFPNLIEQGESGSVEFKTEDVRPESLARELVAFSNTLGGVILIGVDDSGRVIGVRDREAMEQRVVNVARHNVVPAIAPIVEWNEIDSLGVCGVRIPKGQAKPYQTLDGKYLIRVGSTNRQATKEELSRLFQAAGLVHFDLSPVEGTGIDSLDARQLHAYWHVYYQIDYGALESAEQMTILTNADLLVPYEEKLVCSVGGLLLFGREPQRRLPQSSVQFAVFDGPTVADDLLDKKESSGALPDLIERTVGLIRLYLPNPSTVQGLQRQEQEVIPVRVLREALVNAVCHRDYSIYNRRIRVDFFSDRLEITSPGRLPNTLDLTKIRYGNSAPRNFLLLKYLDNMRYIDGLGRGIPMMIREMGDRIDFVENGDLFTVRVALQ